MVHIDIVIPFYTYKNNERIEVTTKIFKHYKNIQLYFKDIAKITFTFIGSEGDVSENMVKEIFSEYRYIEFFQDNYDVTKSTDYYACINMLNKKFVFSYKMSLEINPDICLLAGSNDYISFLFFQQIINFYDPNEKQVYGIDNYKNGNNACLMLEYSLPNRYFCWDGISSFGDREKFHYSGGIIGFNKILYENHKENFFDLLSCDEGMIEYNLLKLPNVKKFNSKNTFYINYKTNASSELNTYDILYSRMKDNIIDFDNMTPVFKDQYNIESKYIKNNFTLEEYFNEKMICQKIGKGNKIEKSVTIGSWTSIGNNNIIGINVVIKDNVKIGDNNFIGDNAIIYENTIICNNNNIYNRNIIRKFPLNTEHDNAIDII